MIIRPLCLMLVFAFAGLSGLCCGADTDPAKQKADEEKKKADEAKKKADEEKKKADEEKKKKAEEEKKKKAEEAKKKAEDAKKRAEEEKKKQDDPANWKPKDFAAVKGLGSSFCIYIKDANRKKNDEAAVIEGKEILGNADTRLKLRAFQRVKIKNDGSDAKGWPEEWLKRAENGALLVVVSGDGTQVLTYDDRTTKGLTASAFQASLEPLIKHDADLKASAAQNAKNEFERKKEEAARAAASAGPEEGKVPGLDSRPKKVADKTDKPKKKEPQDE